MVCWFLVVVVGVGVFVVLEVVVGVFVVVDVVVGVVVVLVVGLGVVVLDVVEYSGGGGGRSCLLYTSPSPRDRHASRMPSSA